MCLYGTEVERRELAVIARCLQFYDIVNPGTLQSKVEQSDDAMRYFLKVIGYCDALVFSRLLGGITAGVGLEINHALSLNLPVYEVMEDRVVQKTDFAMPLSREETLKRFSRWRSMNNNPVLSEDKRQK
jgi:hypothetical protein